MDLSAVAHRLTVESFLKRLSFISAVLTMTTSLYFPHLIGLFLETLCMSSTVYISAAAHRLTRKDLYLSAAAHRPTIKVLYGGLNFFLAFVTTTTSLWFPRSVGLFLILSLVKFSPLSSCHTSHTVPLSCRTSTASFYSSTIRFIILSMMCSSVSAVSMAGPPLAKY
jgi:hypothetical protein